jgi:hypothetical protein
MAGLDNKISNIIGTSIPIWLLKQLEARSEKNTLNSRDTQNILYLANKSAWIRVVSSVNIAEEDIAYFKTLGATISKPDDLAKNYVLFGGTSKYKGANNKNVPSYDIRSGLQNDGAYNLLNNTEINEYGYRPMPGITSVNIETQGALGSIRGATINFKVWDKNQLDIMDALYFKLGYSMFLEWGHTYFYHSSRESPNIDPNVVYSTEDFSIDPFKANLKKEEIYYTISENIRNSEGNYDAMLGVVTNFNFNYNEAGGFDCTLKLMSLGYLGDRIKINQTKVLPNILEEEIKKLNSIVEKIQLASQTTPPLPEKEALTIDSFLRQQKSEGNIVNAQLLYASNPLRITDITIQETRNGKFEYIKKTSIENTGEITPNDRLVNLVKQDNEQYVYITRIGVPVKYDADEYNTGYLDIDKLNNFQSNFTYDFISHVILDKPGDAIGLQRTNYSTGTISTINYKSDTAGGEIDFFIKFSYEGVQVATQIGKDLTKDFVIPAIKEAIKGPLKISIYSEAGGKHTIRLKGEYSIKTTSERKTDSQAIALGDTSLVDTPTSKVANVKKGSFTIELNDSYYLKDIQLNKPSDNNFLERKLYLANLESQNVNAKTAKDEENPNLFVNPNQVHDAIGYMSSLEIMLRTIQVHSLGKAINTTNDADIKREVYEVKLTEETIQGKSLVDQLFSEGIFSSFIQNLINGTVAESGYPKENILAVYAKYGFNTALLGNKTKLSDLWGKSVDYKKLLTSYVVPYEINQSITEGTNLTHPVYIQLGTLFMILNHMCTIYDTPNKADDPKNQTPLIYIDFNPETNFCLSTNKHLSTNPFYFLIPFEGSFKNYKSLFDENLLKGDSINATSGSTELTPLFNPEKDDKLSKQIPRFKYDEKSTSGAVAYKGKIMKVLVNIDYLLQMVKQYSQKNETNNVYLKPFLEQIISDLNKSLGNFNVLRLAYNDSGNTFHIVDDQLTPGDENEDFISPENKDKIPLYGKESIGKNIQIKTDVSTKLSNMIAISANSNPGGSTSKSALSTNSTDFGFINTGYVDRYINNRTDVGSENKKDSRINDTLIKSAIRFNQTISDFYSTINPSDSNVGQATNYYIEKMSKIKAGDSATRASAMIPVSLNFTTDGIAGMNMGQGFTISDKFLPYTYNIRNITGVGVNNIQKVGFVVFGLTHNFENNQWNTDVRANMIYLKKITDFNDTIQKDLAESKQFNYNASNVDVKFTSYNTLTNPVPNPKFIGVNSISPNALDGGPLEQRIINIANDIFKAIRQKEPNIIIRVTAGNDKKHQEITEYTSFHIKGTALDFAISAQGAVPSDKHKQLVNTVLAQFKSKETGFGYIDEYNPKNQNKYNTGGHFHIYYSS